MSTGERVEVPRKKKNNLINVMENELNAKNSGRMKRK
jgi:hypothetical protein